MANKHLGREFTKGLLRENPTFRLVLGTCPTLAVTTSAQSALGMGAAAAAVLVCSNVADIRAAQGHPAEGAHSSLHHHHRRLCFHCTDAGQGLSSGD